MTSAEEDIPTNAYDAKLVRIATALHTMEQESYRLAEIVETEQNTSDEERLVPDSLKSIISRFLDRLYTLWDIIDSTRDSLSVVESLGVEHLNLCDIKNCVTREEDIELMRY